MGGWGGAIKKTLMGLLKKIAHFRKYANMLRYLHKFKENVPVQVMISLNGISLNQRPIPRHRDQFDLTGVKGGEGGGWVGGGHTNLSPPLLFVRY